MNSLTLITSPHFHQQKNLCFIDHPSLKFMVLSIRGNCFYSLIWYMATDECSSVCFKNKTHSRSCETLLKTKGWNFGTMMNKTFHHQIRRYPPLPWSPVWSGLLRIDFLFNDQLLPRTFFFRHATIRVYRAGKRKHSSTKSSVTTQSRMTLRKPSLSSGLFWPVHGTPPTFMPNTALTVGQELKTFNI